MPRMIYNDHLGGGWGESPGLRELRKLYKDDPKRAVALATNVYGETNEDRAKANAERMEKLINPPFRLNAKGEAVAVDMDMCGNPMGIPEDGGWSEDNLRDKAKCVLDDAERAGQKQWAHNEIRRIIRREGCDKIVGLNAGGRRRAHKTFCDLHRHIQKMHAVVQPSRRVCPKCTSRSMIDDPTRARVCLCEKCGLRVDKDCLDARRAMSPPAHDQGPFFRPPMDRMPPPIARPAFVFPRGKFKGRTIREVPCKYLVWIIFGRVPGSWEKYIARAKKELARRELNDLFILDPDRAWYTRSERDADLAEKRAHNRGEALHDYQKVVINGLTTKEMLIDTFSEDKAKFFGVHPAQAEGRIHRRGEKPKKERSFCSKLLWK